MDIEKDYANFGDVCRNELGITCQYGFYLLHGLRGSEKMIEGLRIIGETNSYHSLKIHKEDVQKFKDKYKAFVKRYSGEGE